MRHVAGGEIGEIALGQGLQREARPPGADHEDGAVARAFEHHLRAFRELAHDVVEHVGGHGRDAARRHIGRDRLEDFEIEIGRLEGELPALGANKHIGQDRNSAAPLDHTMDMRQRAQQLGPLDSDFHAALRSADMAGAGLIRGAAPLEGRARRRLPAPEPVKVPRRH